ncbi:MAG: helix-turn-helix domain-containing protein [Porcipelethomonas sp.]
MDLIQTGKFIATLRKEKGLTQEQLGEKVGVTNKTVSRWETGTYLPPADILLAMSELFDVSINELLSGNKLTENEYKQAAEKNLRQAVKDSSFTINDRIKFYKKKWLQEHTAIMALIGICIAGVFAAGCVMKNLLIIYAAVLISVSAHGWRNNKMMTYVEKNAYYNSGIK